jgi:hypothetical protein
VNDQQPPVVLSDGPVDRTGRHVDADTCIDLLYHLLPAGAAAGVFSHLTSCPSCERRLREIVSREERIRARWVLSRDENGELVLRERDAAEADHRVGVGTRELAERLRTGWGRLRRRSQIAAGLGISAAMATVVLLIVLPSPGSENRDFVPEMLPQYGSDIRFRAAVSGSMNESLASGLRSYEGRDFESAVDLLSRATSNGLLEILRRVYLADASERTGRHAAALEALRGIPLDVLPDPWGTTGRWTMVRALRGTGRGAAADSLLRTLAAEPGATGERARSLLRR